MGYYEGYYGGNNDGVCDVGEYCYGDGMQTSGSSGQVDFNKLADKLSDAVTLYDYSLDAYVVATLNDGAAFVENSEIELRYNCAVAGVNADGVEGPVSDIAANPADDAVGPKLVPDSPGGALACPNTGNSTTLAIGTICDLSTADGGDGVSTTIDQVVLKFNEVMNEASAETIGNYNVVNGATTVSAISNAVYDVTSNTVLLNLTTPVNPTALAKSTITGGTNGVVDSEATLAGDDVIVRPTCVTEGATSVTALGDDVDSTPGAGGGVISVGPNGVCQTTAAGDGTQVLPAGTGVPSSACVGPGVNGVLNTTVVGDDTIAGNRINSGANGICQTTATGDDTQDIPVGEGLPATSINAGPNMVLDTVPPGGSDDVITHQPGVKVTGSVTGVTDVGVNGIRDSYDEFNTDGTVQ